MGLVGLIAIGFRARLRTAPLIIRTLTPPRPNTTDVQVDARHGQLAILTEVALLCPSGHDAARGLLGRFVGKLARLGGRTLAAGLLPGVEGWRLHLDHRERVEEIAEAINKELGAEAVRPADRMHVGPIARLLGADALADAFHTDAGAGLAPATTTAAAAAAAAATTTDAAETEPVAGAKRRIMSELACTEEQPEAAKRARPSPSASSAATPASAAAAAVAVPATAVSAALVLSELRVFVPRYARGGNQRRRLPLALMGPRRARVARRVPAEAVAAGHEAGAADGEAGKGVDARSHSDETTVTDPIMAPVGPEPRDREDDGSVHSVSSVSLDDQGFEDDEQGDEEEGGLEEGEQPPPPPPQQQQQQQQFHHGEEDDMGFGDDDYYGEGTGTIIDLEAESDEEEEEEEAATVVEEQEEAATVVPQQEPEQEQEPEGGPALHVHELTDAVVECHTQTGRRSRATVGKARLLEGKLQEPPFATAQALRIDVSFHESETHLAAHVVATRLQHVRSLCLGIGGDGTKRAPHPAVLRALARLTHLRELLLPHEAMQDPRAFAQGLQHVHTLHLVSQYGSLPALPCPAPSVKMLTLAVFDGLGLQQLKRVLRAFPNLQRLALRLCIPANDLLPFLYGPDDWRAQLEADHATFPDRPAGWAAALTLDVDAAAADGGENEEAAVVSTTARLDRFDEATGGVVRSPWDLCAVYEAMASQPGLKAKGYYVEEGRMMVCRP
jgi:hypothetical protein